MAVYEGTTGNDVLWSGMDGGDPMYGGTLLGGDGDDRLIGGPGPDMLDGGPHGDMGDTADYSQSPAPVHIDLSMPFGGDDDDPGPVYGGYADGDTISGIENIWGSEHGDELHGHHVANMIWGRGGNDHIYGMAGADKLWGMDGDDVIDGGRGNDKLFGGMGEDLLMGGTGNDYLMGQGGDDILEGDSGNDILEGGMGADEIDGGSGEDTASYAGSEDAVMVDLGARGGPSAEGGDAEGDMLTSVENLRGSDDDDELTGDDDDNKLYGNMGEDTLMGGDGDDTIRGGKHDDEIDGGDGDDMIQGDMGDDMLTGGDGEDTFILMEGDGDDEITDFEQGEDTIQLGPATEKLSAADIRDVLDTEDDNRDGTYTYDWEDVSITVDVPLTEDDFGVQATSNRLTEGNDHWHGTSGDDTIHGLGGDDELDGEDGDDTLFGNAGDDNLFGGDDDDYLSGGRGDDNLMGGSGRDMLYGGSGNDMLSGNRGNDMLTGGSGYDTFSFGPRDGYDTITDFHQGDIIKLGDMPLSMDDIDDVLDTVRVNDDGDYIYDWMETRIVVNRPLTEDDFEKAPVEPEPDPSVHKLTDASDTWGSTDMNEDDYNGGDDYVDGDGGNDTIMGGAGNDTLKGGDHNDNLQGEDGDDSLYGNNGDDTLMGGDDDDMLVGGDGMDTLDGGDGDDMVYADLADFDDTGGRTPMVTGGDGDDDTLSFMMSTGPIGSDGTPFTADASFENLIGSPQDDFLQAAADATEATMATTNMVSGGGGNDTLTVAGGVTEGVELNGGAGNDTITGGGGPDMLNGGEGMDSLTGGAGNDTLDGGAGMDTLVGGDGTDTFIWGDGDTVTFVQADDNPIELPDDVMRVAFDLHGGGLRATLEGGTMDGESMTFTGITTVPTTETAIRTLLDELFTGGDGDLYAL